MKKLKTAVKMEIQKRKMENLEELKNSNTIGGLLSKWFCRSLIPASSQNRKWKSAKELKTYLVNRIEKMYAKELEQEFKKIDLVSTANDFDSIDITIEWKKSRMWGSNPSAEAFVKYKNGSGERFYSGSIGGCGYDKTSTAVANCLNQVNGLLKRLYKVKNNNIKTKNRELFGYGSGYGILPSIEGGVGVSCYDGIMEKIKLEFKSVASGNTFDVFSIARKRK